MDERDLDQLLGQARANPPAPSEAFMARVTAEALAHQPRVAAPVAMRPPRAASPRSGLWSLFAGFGGGGVVAGLGAVAVLGLFYGYADPAGLTDEFLTTSGTELELVPVATLFLTEG